MISVCLSELYYKAVWGCWWWTGKVPVVCGFDNSKEVVEKHWGCSLPVCFGEAVSGSGGRGSKSKAPKSGEETPLFGDICTAAFSMHSTGAPDKEFLQGPPH